MFDISKLIFCCIVPEEKCCDDAKEMPPHVVKQLDAATRSSLQPVRLYFKNYDAGQIKQILLGRARKGLRSWDESDISQISALTTQRTNSDARVAIKTLYYKVMSPQGSTEKCFEEARKDIYKRYCLFSRNLFLEA